MEFFNNKNFKKVGGIYNFEIKDEKTLKVRDFYKVDPFPNYEIDDNKLTILNAGDANQFTKNLKEFIDHKKIVLEIGAGTSQLSNYLSIGNNNLLIAFDGNLESLKIGNTFCEKNNIINVKFVCGDIFDDIFQENTFDVILCNGVLHHTKNSYEAFKKSVRWLKTNGYIVLGLYNKIGRFRTFFRKWMYKIFGEKYLMIFDPVLRKINKKSKRKINAWIKDQYNHPLERSHTFDEVLKWFKEENVEFINSLPQSTIFEKTNREEVFINLFQKEKKGNFFERILSQIFMIFQHEGSEGGLFIFIGKKCS